MSLNEGVYLQHLSYCLVFKYILKLQSQAAFYEP